MKSWSGSAQQRRRRPRARYTSPNTKDCLVEHCQGDGDFLNNLRIKNTLAGQESDLPVRALFYAIGTVRVVLGSYIAINLYTSDQLQITSQQVRLSVINYKPTQTDTQSQSRGQLEPLYGAYLPHGMSRINAIGRRLRAPCGCGWHSVGACRSWGGINSNFKLCVSIGGKLLLRTS